MDSYAYTSKGQRLLVYTIYYYYIKYTFIISILKVIFSCHGHNSIFLYQILVYPLCSLHKKAPIQCMSAFC